MSVNQKGIAKPKVRSKPVTLAIYVSSEKCTEFSPLVEWQKQRQQQQQENVATGRIAVAPGILNIFARTVHLVL